MWTILTNLNLVGVSIRYQVLRICSILPSIQQFPYAYLVVCLSLAGLDVELGETLLPAGYDLEGLAGVIDVTEYDGRVLFYVVVHRETGDYITESSLGTEEGCMCFAASLGSLNYSYEVVEVVGIYLTNLLFLTLHINHYHITRGCPYLTPNHSILFRIVLELALSIEFSLMDVDLFVLVRGEKVSVNLHLHLNFIIGLYVVLVGAVIVHVHLAVAYY